LAAVGFLGMVTWSCSSWTAHPSSYLYSASSSCLRCPGLLHHMGTPQLELRERDPGLEAELG